MIAILVSVMLGIAIVVGAFAFIALVAWLADRGHEWIILAIVGLVLVAAFAKSFYPAILTWLAGS